MLELCTLSTFLYIVLLQSMIEMVCKIYTVSIKGPPCLLMSILPNTHCFLHLKRKRVAALNRLTQSTLTKTDSYEGQREKEI